MFTSKINVLVTAEVNKTMLEELGDSFDFKYVGYSNGYQMLTQEELKDYVKGASILISEFDMITEDIISSSNLKMIICCRAGVSTVVDLESARRHNIIVCRNQGRNKEATADFTIALIYDLFRHISLTNQIIHSDGINELRGNMPDNYGDSLWGLDGSSPYIKYRGPSMKDVVIGILGYGYVGHSVAERLDRIGIKYIIHTNNPDKDNSLFVDKETLLKESDLITIHVSGNSEKRPIFGLEEMKLMKQSAYLINTSRGYLVNEDDLIKALNEGMIAGAALDVSVEEPISKDSKLLTARNLILTPHIAGSSEETIVYGTKMVMDALKGFLKDDIPNRVV